MIRTLFTRNGRGEGDRGTSLVEYGLLVSLVLTGSLATFDGIEDGVEDHYESTADDIGNPDLKSFAPPTSSTVAPPTSSTSSTTSTTTTSTTTTSTLPIVEDLSANASEAALSGPWTTYGDGSVGTPESSGDNFGGPSGTSLSMTFTLVVGTPGNYQINALAFSNNGGSDSFYMKVNGIEYTWNGIQNGVTQTVTNGVSAPRPPVTLSLPAGPVNITFYKREGGARVGNIALVPVP